MRLLPCAIDCRSD